MIYDCDFDSPNKRSQVECAILVKPKAALENWPAMTERSITQVQFPVELGFDKIKDKAVNFATQYIAEHKNSWKNSPEFAGVMFRYPNGMVKRYDYH